MIAPATLAVVIATCRPESFKRWFEAWKDKLDGVAVYVVEDQPKKTEDLQIIERIIGWHHYSWEEIDADLGKKSWVIPRRTSAIKSYGFLKAWQDGHDYIWTLDDDCFPEPHVSYVDDIKWELRNTHPDDSWHNTIYWTGLYPRGYPYGIRQQQQPVMIHHGLWSGVPDLDGITALEHSKLRMDPVHGVRRVPTGQFFPMCGMNLAFQREMAPAMHFGLQGRMRDDAYDHVLGPGQTNPLPFDRFDDIWAGLFAKKICDHRGYAVTSGGPSIIHTKESDPTMRVIKEGPGIAVHEKLWEHIRDTKLTVTTVADCYRQLARSVREFSVLDPDRSEYWKLLARAMFIWTEFFDE
jgi:hypothetical protein